MFRSLLAVFAVGSCTAQPAPSLVLAADGYLTTPVAGLERTGATARQVAVSGQPFPQALEVAVAQASAETNATQLTVPNLAPVKKGDGLLVTYWLSGQAKTGEGARVEFMFERSTSPWTKSVTHPATSRPDGSWRAVSAAFLSAEDYAPGEAMASIRLAFGPQTVRIGGLQIQNFGTSKTLDELQLMATDAAPLGRVEVSADFSELKQTMRGLGGNFCQPRYGRAEAMDAVGQYSLDNLEVVTGRIGIPLNHYAPSHSKRILDGPAGAAMEAMAILKKRGMPVIASVWEASDWILPGEQEAMGKVLPRAAWGEFISLTADWMVEAKRRHGVVADYFSFNEPDYGVNVKFTPQELADFIAQAAPIFRQRGLSTKFLTGDTANGSTAAEYARVLLGDSRIKDVLGPVAFHSWDALAAADGTYSEIAAVARQHGREVWCTEAGHDAALWQKENPWQSEENALRTAAAYARTIRLTESSTMMYWTYQDNYPMNDGKAGYPIFRMMEAMGRMFGPGDRMASISLGSSGLEGAAMLDADGKTRWMMLVNTGGAGEAVVSGLAQGGKVSAFLGSTGKSVAVAVKGGQAEIKIGPREVIFLRAEAN